MNFFKNNLDKTLEKLVKNFLSKIKYGNLEVEFPSGERIIYSGIKDGISASIHIHNYNFLSYIFKRGSIGYAEAYMKGFYTTKNLTNLLLLSHKNEKYLIIGIGININKSPIIIDYPTCYLNEFSNTRWHSW